MIAQSFEELAAWRKARELVNAVYVATKRPRFSEDQPLVEQLRKSALSIASSVAEAFERGSDRELLRCLFAAKGCCGEVRSQLYSALDQRYLTQTEFDEVRRLTLDLATLIGTLTVQLRDVVYRGEPFRPRATAHDAQAQAALPAKGGTHGNWLSRDRRRVGEHEPRPAERG